MFEFLGRYLLIAIEWVNNNIIQNYALSIVLFTGLIKLISLPADIKQRQSTAKMAAVQPEVQKIQKRYESSPEVMQRKMQELYKKEKVSPYASCLPLLVTMVIFMIFLRAMTFWSHIGSIDIFLNAREQQLQAAEAGEELVIVRGAENDQMQKYKWAWVHNIWMPDSFMANSIMQYDQFSRIPFDSMDLYFDEELLGILSSVTESQYDEIMQPYARAYGDVKNGWGFMPVLAAGSMLLIQLLQKKINPQQAQMQQGAQPGMNSNMMMIVMAVFSGVICFQSNTAFSLYWLASNFFSLLVTLGLELYGRNKRKKMELESGNIVM